MTDMEVRYHCRSLFYPVSLLSVMMCGVVTCRLGSRWCCC